MGEGVTQSRLGLVVPTDLWFPASLLVKRENRVEDSQANCLAGLTACPPSPDWPLPVQRLPYDLPRGFWLRKSSLPAMLYLSLCVAFPIAGLTYLASPSTSLYHALVRPGVSASVSASTHCFLFISFVSFMCLCLPPCAASFSAACLPADSALLLLLLSHCWLAIMLSRATCTAKAPSWFGGRWAWGC